MSKRTHKFNHGAETITEAIDIVGVDDLQARTKKVVESTGEKQERSVLIEEFSKEFTSVELAFLFTEAFEQAVRVRQELAGFQHMMMGMIGGKGEK